MKYKQTTMFLFTVLLKRTVRHWYCTTLAITNAPNFSQLEVNKDGLVPDQLS